jgi:hypothetical protein
VGTGTGPRRFAAEPTAIHAFRATVYSSYCTSYSKVGPLGYLSGLTLPAHRNAYLIRTRAVRRWNRTERSWPVSSYLPGPAPDKSFFLLLFSGGEEVDTIGPMNFHW